MWVYIKCFGSFIFLVFASWCVGEGGEILGKKYDASIIGGILIAWLNTAPETIFFITALHSNNPRFAIGAASGSSIVVCTVALGACLWIGSNARRTGRIVLQPAVKKQCLILFCSLSVTSTIALIGFNLVCGVIGVAFYIGFIIFSLNTKNSHSPSDDDSKIDDLENDNGSLLKEGEEEEEGAGILYGVGYLVVGGGLILGFSGIFINSVVEVASILQVNPILLAFFLAPVASEAPEILESISLSRKGNSQNINIAFSNLVGGTVTKTTLLVAIFCFYGVSRNFEWEVPNYTISLLLLIVCAAISSSIGYLFRVQTAIHGMVLLALFFATGIIQYYFNSVFVTEDPMRSNLPTTPVISDIGTPTSLIQ